MIPYRDDIPCEHPAIMTWALIGVNFAIFLYCLSLADKTLHDLFYYYGLVPVRYTQPQWAQFVGFDPHDYWPFFSSMFLHSNWMHVILNMWMLWIFGDNIEDRMGPIRFSLFFLACGLAAGGVHVLANPDSPIATIGASGAVAGILGAYYLLYPFAQIVVWIPILFLPIFIYVPAIAFLGFWVIIQIGQATAPNAGQAFEDVAWVAHLGGFVTGLLIYRYFLRPNQDSKPVAD